LPSATDPTSALRISIMRLARRLRSERAENELTLSQLSALATVACHGPLSPGELAAHERIQPPSMTRIVAALVERGLVVRAQHPTDRRQQLLTIAEPGSGLLAEQRRRRDAWLARRLAALTPAERATLREATEILGRLAAE
jgi:DNA-binding MarR family transcriptional regulator